VQRGPAALASRLAAEPRERFRPKAYHLAAHLHLEHVIEQFMQTRQPTIGMRRSPYGVPPWKGSQLLIFFHP
jgi:hypothetical protein